MASSIPFEIQFIRTELQYIRTELQYIRTGLQYIRTGLQYIRTGLQYIRKGVQCEPIANRGSCVTIFELLSVLSRLWGSVVTSRDPGLKWTPWSSGFGQATKN
jgi:hypothetical protein